MTALDLSSPVAVVGSGTMGQGIAQVALVAGHPVRLYDAVPGRAREAAAAIGARLDRLVEKERLTGAERDAAWARLRPAGSLAELADSALVVEAVPERLDVKRDLLRELEDVVAEDCLLATNTSSLPVTAVGGALRVPGRFVGLHFFNPAPLLPLVEVVSGSATDVTSATRAYETARAWGKTPVACADTPGFIVNRVARPFYAEAFAVYEAHGADPATIDAVLRECGGFRMGAFELTDLIGQDVNESVTHSVWQSLFQDVRFTPSLAQRRLVESGRAGPQVRTGLVRLPGRRRAPRAAHRGDRPAARVRRRRGRSGPRVRPARADPRGGRPGARGGRGPRHPAGAAQRRAAGARRRPDLGGVPGRRLLRPRPGLPPGGRIALSASQDTSPQTLAEATGLFQALGKKVSVIGDVPGMIVARTVARIVDLAHDAVAKGVATEEDIDTAMRLGVNYPLGPFEWSRRLGRSWAYALLDDLHLRDPSGRYAPSLALYRHAYATDKREGSTS
ncbi:hypothetical protein GCM10020295_41060 [Streptomyces cinereospinus]